MTWSVVSGDEIGLLKLTQGSGSGLGGGGGGREDDGSDAEAEVAPSRPHRLRWRQSTASAALSRANGVDAMAWSTQGDGMWVATRAAGVVLVPATVPPPVAQARRQRKAGEDEGDAAGATTGSEATNGVPPIEFAPRTRCHTIKLSAQCCGLSALGEDRLVAATRDGTVQVAAWSADGAAAGAADSDAEPLVRFSAGAALSVMRLRPDAKVLATGGDKNLLKLWDAEGTQVWAAKNVSNDFLELEVPVWPTDVCFLEEEHSLATCTAHGFVRIYDTRASQKPVQAATLKVERYENNVAASSKHLTAIARTRPLTFAVADAAGTLAEFDARRMQESSKFKAFNGSIRALHKHPTLPLLASACIDRHVRVHDVNTRELVCCVYSKQRQTTVLFAPRVWRVKKRDPKVFDNTEADVVQDLSSDEDNGEEQGRKQSNKQKHKHTSSKKPRRK